MLLLAVRVSEGIYSQTKASGEITQYEYDIQISDEISHRPLIWQY